MISLIAAVADNQVIGSNNDLPWHIPADLKHFRELTTGHAVIMGSNTYNAISERLGGPLPNRLNVVLTHNEAFNIPGVACYRSLNKALANHPDAFIIGGASIYEQTIGLADRLYITEVHASPDGDTYFPPIDRGRWHEVLREDHKADVKNQFDYSFITYEKI